MKWVKRLPAFLGSATLTVWLAGLFVLYYLTVAVWSQEAFAALVNRIANDMVFRLLSGLLVLNVMARSINLVIRLRRAPLTLILRLPLLVGLVVFLGSYFMSLNVRETAKVLAWEGDLVEVPWENSLLRVVKMESALKKHALKTDDAFIFDYEPALTLTDGKGASVRVGAFPPRKVLSTYVHILNFGFGPYVELKRNKGEVLQQGFVPLRLTPFGKVDDFEIPPYRFYLNVLPNRVVKKGKETAREYDLDRPLYGVSVSKGDKLLARKETDRSMPFDGSLSLNFSAPADWVLLEAAYDPFLPWVAIGLLLSVAGCLLYPFSFLASSG